ncbi:MAG: molybdenum cofactor guanylyltransferase [Acidiferrobacterales bacterium]|nr:molybdenum cofactor guanylyltransferase [Acidiferrobacterales bacterium]
MASETDTLDGRVTGVILAGGQARRMGGIDKGLVELNGVAMCKIVIDRLQPQVSEVLVNANRNLALYNRFGVRVICDETPGFLGPLAGLASAMAAARSHWVITVPCDGPFLSGDYVARMTKMAAEDVEIVVARDSDRLQPTYILAQKRLLDSLDAFLRSGERKIDRWFVRHRYAEADFSDSPQCFLNINTEQDRNKAQLRISQDG